MLASATIAVSILCLGLRTEPLISLMLAFFKKLHEVEYVDSGKMSDLTPSLIESREFVSKLKQGDPAAFEDLVREFSSKLLAVTMKVLGNESDARDALQETFVSVFRSIGSFEERAKLGTWLHRIAVNAALIKLRSVRRKGEVSIDDLLPGFDDAGCRIEPAYAEFVPLEDLVEKVEVQEMVRNALATLPENYCNVLIMRDILGHSSAEIATELGVAEGTAKVRIHRARAALKRLLEPVFLEEAGT